MGKSSKIIVVFTLLSVLLGLFAFTACENDEYKMLDLRHAYDKDYIQKDALVEMARTLNKLGNDAVETRLVQNAATLDENVVRMIKEGYFQEVSSENDGATIDDVMILKYYGYYNGCDVYMAEIVGRTTAKNWEWGFDKKTRMFFNTNNAVYAMRRYGEITSTKTLFEAVQFHWISDDYLKEIVETHNRVVETEGWEPPEITDKLTKTEERRMKKAYEKVYREAKNLYVRQYFGKYNGFSCAIMTDPDFGMELKEHTQVIDGVTFRYGKTLGIFVFVPEKIFKEKEGDSPVIYN